MTAIAATLPLPRAEGAVPRALVVARAAVVLLLCLLPLPLGCAGPDWRAFAVLALVSTTLFLLWQLRAAGRGLSLPPGVLWIAVFLMVPAIQLLPIGFGEASPLLLDLRPTTGSVVPARTSARLLDLAVLGLVFVVACQAFVSGRTVRLLLGALLTVAVLQVGYGALAASGAVPLLDPLQTDTVLVGTFVNRNHLANLLAMAAIAGLGLFGAQLVQGRPPHQLLLVGTGIVVAWLGIFATSSRGGVLIAVAGTVVFALLAAPWSLRARVLLAMLLLAAAALGALLWPQELLQRFASLGHEATGGGSRVDIWVGALAIWRAFPWLGAGLGTFGDLSPTTQSPAVPGRIENAHNDAIELLVETGVIGLLLATVAVFVLVFSVARRCRAVPDRSRALLGAGALAAVVASLLQALVEFQLQIPANAAWLAVLAGVAVGVTRSRQATRTPRLMLPALWVLGGLTLAASVDRVVRGEAAVGLVALEHGLQLLPTDRDGAASAAAAALAANPCSPRAHLLAAECSLPIDAAMARQSFARALHWTNAAGRWQRQRDIALRCVAAGQIDEARHWFADLLPALPVDRQRQVLTSLVELVPLAELADSLLPRSAPSVRAELAEVLLRAEDFAGRELVLSRLAGRSPVPLTVNSQVVLTRSDLRVETRADGQFLHVALAFSGDPAAPVALRCEGPDAAIYRSFDTVDDYRWTMHLDTAFPPGEYELSLDFRADAPHFPFARITREASTLALAPGQRLQATDLYWSTAEPSRRIHAAGTIPLRSGDRLWREIELAGPAADLVLRTRTGTRLRVMLDDRELSAVASTFTRLHRVALPAAARGSLAITAVGDDAPELLELTVTPGGKP